MWRQQYILRFNEDGKKAKSKGNHIWSIEAKKSGDNKWEFRPFHRKLAGPPPVVAYAGLRWSWKPRIWDPQISFKKIQVTYSSPSLPPWLSWKNGELSGVPSPDAENCQVTAVAKVRPTQTNANILLTLSINIIVHAGRTRNRVATCFHDLHRSSFSSRWFFLFSFAATFVPWWRIRAQA